MTEFEKPTLHLSITFESFFNEGGYLFVVLNEIEELKKALSPDIMNSFNKPDSMVYDEEKHPKYLCCDPHILDSLIELGHTVTLYFGELSLEVPPRSKDQWGFICHEFENKYTYLLTFVFCDFYFENYSKENAEIIFAHIKAFRSNQSMKIPL